jgi:hypothetical protein
MSSAELQIDPYGPVFISYRHSDGKSIADRVSTLLKSVGVPVWIDSEAMQVGHIEKRVNRAIEQTISGAIVISTEDTARSDVISKNEVPGLLRLLDNDPTFPICIINVNDKDAVREGLDYSAPDRRMRTVTVESDLRGPLSSIKQFGVEEEDLIALVGAMATERVKRIHQACQEKDDRIVRLGLYSWEESVDHASSGNHLDLRLAAPKAGDRFNREALKTFKDTLKETRKAVESVSPSVLQVEGRAHLFLAFVLGAQFPETFVKRAIVRQSGENWGRENNGDQNESFLHLTDQRVCNESSAGRARVAVYLDLVAGRLDSAFTSFVEANKEKISYSARIGMREPGQIDPNDGARIAREASNLIRDLSSPHGSSSHGAAHIDLMMRCPLPLAFLIGRNVNTLSFTVYEYERNKDRYVPMLDVDTFNRSNVITKVLV